MSHGTVNKRSRQPGDIPATEMTKKGQSLQPEHSARRVDISIVTTLYNSEPYIREFYERVMKAANSLSCSWELVFVNDGSPDNSLGVAVSLSVTEENVRIIDLSRNFGHHQAIMAGLEHSCGRRVFLIDVDLEEQPEWLVRFARVQDETKADVVFGQQESRADGRFRGLLSRAFYAVFNSVSDTPIPHNPCTVRIMTRAYVQALMSMRETCLFLAGTFQWAGFHQHPIVVQKECRAASSSYTLRRRLALLLNAVTSFSAYPLHIIFFIGVALTVFSMAAGGGMIIYRIVKGDALQVGWASIMVSVWFLGGMTIAMVGVIGLYLSKVFEEVKARPRFLVKQTIDVSSQANKTT